MVGDKTNIQISRKTRDRIAQYGKKGDSYEDILVKILDEYEQE